MTDIVDELRSHFSGTGIIKSATSDLVKNAAAEIERLQDEVVSLGITLVGVEEVNALLRAENATLLAAAQTVTDAMCEAAMDAAARDRIQGFSYAKRHVIRDVWADKELWSAPVGSSEDYQAFQRQCQIERMRKTLTAALSLSSAQ